MKQRKRLLAMLIAALMLAALFPTAAGAEAPMTNSQKTLGIVARSSRYDVWGYTAAGDPIQTTYSNAGYATYIQHSGSKGEVSLRKSGDAFTGNDSRTGLGLELAYAFINGGNYLQLTYTLTNSGAQEVSGVDLGVCADVQIGTDDSASIYGTDTGFRMVNTKTDTDDPGHEKQFTLICKGAAGVQDVSTMWFGYFGDRVDNLYTNTTATELTGRDSGLAFSWQSLSVPGNGGSVTRSVLFGVNANAAPPQQTKPMRLYLKAEGDADILVNAEITDEAGLTDTLYYTINNGLEQVLGSVVAAGAQTKTITGVISKDNFTPDGTYTVMLWIMNSKGALSQVVTKTLTTSTGADGKTTVTVLNASGQPEQVTVATGTNVVQPLDRPTNLAWSTATPGQVNATWDSVQGADYYYLQIYQNQDGNSVPVGAPIQVSPPAGGGTVSYDCTTALNGAGDGQYTFAVMSANDHTGSLAASSVNSGGGAGNGTIGFTAPASPGGTLSGITQPELDAVFGPGVASLNGNMVVLNRPITLENPITLGTDMNLDLKGHDIRGPEGSSAIIIGQDGVDLSISSTSGAVGVIHGGDGVNGGNGGAAIDMGAHTGSVTVGNKVTAQGGNGGDNSNGSGGNGGAGIAGGASSGQSVTLEGSSSSGHTGSSSQGGDGGNGGSTGSGGNGGSGISLGGNGSVSVAGGSASSGGDGGAGTGGTGGNGGSGVSLGSGSASIGGSSTGGSGGTGSTGGAGGDGTSLGGGNASIGGNSAGGNGGTGSNGGNGGSGVSLSGGAAASGSGSAQGGNGGNVDASTGTGGNGGIGGAGIAGGSGGSIATEDGHDGAMVVHGGNVSDITSSTDNVLGSTAATYEFDANGNVTKVTLTADVILQNPLVLDQSVTLDLNGHTLSGKPGDAGQSGGTAIGLSGGAAATVTGPGSVSGGAGGSGSTGGGGGAAINTGSSGGSLTIGQGVAVTGGTGGNASSYGGGGTGGPGITGGGSTAITVNGSVSGGTGGNAKGSGNGGDGGTGIAQSGGGQNAIAGGGSVTGGNGGSSFSGTPGGGGQGVTGCTFPGATNGQSGASQAKYTVTIMANGESFPGGQYSSGDTVDITAPTIKGYVFKNWTCDDARIVFQNAAQSATSFTMPGYNLTVTANYTEGGGSYDSYDPGPGAGKTDTAYNSPSQSGATIWLTSSGLSQGDLLITSRLESGSVYDAMRALAGGHEIFRVYDISLSSGKTKLDGGKLTFDLNEKYAGQAFTLVHKKADGTVEFFTATADAKGDLTFSPVYELSPFMLVKGTLQGSLSLGIPKTGGAPYSGWACIGLAALSLLGLALSAKGKKEKA